MKGMKGKGKMKQMKGARPTKGSQMGGSIGDGMGKNTGMPSQPWMTGSKKGGK